jgi:SSS family transporter
MAVKVGMLVLFVIVTVAIGVWCRGQARSVDGFVLGGRNVGSWLTAFAYGTSYFSAVIFIGYAGQFGWKYGMSATWVGIGNAVVGSLLAWVVLGPRTRRMTRAIGAQTMPEFFGQRYASRGLRIAAALIIFVFLVPYTASVYNGLSRLFYMAFGLPYEVCIVGMAAVTCVYVVLGGYRATVLNDAVQGVIMLVSIVAVIVAVLGANGGLGTAVQTLSTVEDPTQGVSAGSLTSLFGPDAAGLLSVVVLTSLGTWGLPQMVQKFYAIRDDAAIRRGTVISTLFALVVAGGSYFLGGFGRLYADRVTYLADGTPAYDSIVPTMLSTVPDVLIGIVVVLVLSASMSTLSSLVLTSSSSLTLDFLCTTVMRKVDERTSVRTMRGLVVVFVALSAVIALVQYNSSSTFIAQLMGISWGALAGAFLAPFFYGLYWKGATAAGAWACFAFGVGFTVLNMFIGFAGSSIVAGAVAMVAGFVIVPVVSLFTRKPPEQSLSRAFGDERAA